MKPSARSHVAFSYLSTWTLLSVLATAGSMLSWVAQPGLAQSTSADLLLQNPQSGENSSDPFSNRGDGQSSSVFDLIHRASLGNIRSQSEFRQEQQENINNEAATFRTLQLELLRQQIQPEAIPSPDAPLPQN